MSSTSNYPGALDQFTNPTPTNELSDSTVLHSTQHAQANDAIEAIQATLGVDPQGSSSTVAERIAGVAGSGFISAQAYGVVADGATDDTSAWVAALAAANGRAVLHPGGTSVVSSATRLAITVNGTGIIGSPFGSTIKFTNASGGIDVGDGSNNIYETTFRDITIHGGATATTVVRCRNMYEPLFDNVQIISSSTSTGSALLQMDNCGQLDGRRLILSTAPIGLNITGTTLPVINIDLANFYALTECVRIAGAGLARMRLTGWCEACPDVVTVNATGAVSIGELTLDHLRVLNTTGSQHLVRAVASTGINSQVIDIDACYIDAQSSSVGLVDFTAFANPSTIFVRMRDCIPLLNQTTPPVLVQVNAAQSWPIFHVAMSNIMATDLYYPTSQWASNPMATGGVWLAPLQLQGSNTPEGAVAAPPGSTYQRVDGGDLAVYVKAAGTGNTGWFALAVSGSDTIEAPITAVSTDAINNDFGVNILQVERSAAESSDPSTVVFGVNGAAQARVGYDGTDSQGTFLAQTSGTLMQYGPGGMTVLAGTGISFYAAAASDRVAVTQGVFGLPIFATTSRPSAATAGQGATIFDTTVGKPVFSDGANWKTFDGTIS